MSEETGRAPQEPRALGSVILSDFSAGEGAASPENILNRFLEAHKTSSKQAHYLLGISIIIVAFYLIKIVGLRVDVVLLDQKIFKLPYGVFIFCACSQICFVAGLARFLDARTFDRYIRAICERIWPNQVDLMYQSYIAQFEWLSPFQFMSTTANLGRWFRFFEGVANLFIFLLLIGLLISPIASGIFFLADWKNQILGQYSDFQYWLVAATTLLSITMLILVFAYYAIDNEK